MRTTQRITICIQHNELRPGQSPTCCRRYGHSQDAELLNNSLTNALLQVTTDDRSQITPVPAASTATASLHLFSGSMRYLLALATCLWVTIPGQAQSWGIVTGYVYDSTTQHAMPGVTVIVHGTDFGTAATKDGRYSLQLPVGQYALQFSFIGYASRVDSVTVLRDTPFELTVNLTPEAVEMTPVTIEDHAVAGAGVHRLDPEHVQNIPTPFKGFQALASLPGVASANELSNQYSVRGGGFNENLIFLNGFEIYMPFRPRQGEQEGLGLLNAELARRITLYTGGFPVRYGGKISSSLDIHYAASDSFRASSSISLLDAGATASATHGQLAWVLGLRKAQARRFFSTQELKGNYQPDYTDAQGLVRYSLSPHHTMELLGIWAHHDFALDPRSRRTYYGTVAGSGGTADLRSVWIRYDDKSLERDGYETQFLGLLLQSRLGPRFQVRHDASVFRTEETEQLTLAGNTIIYNVVAEPGGDADLIPRGNAQQEDFADNRVRVTTYTGKGRYALLLLRHAAEVGWSVRRLRFDDHINEYSAISGQNTDGNRVRIVVDSLQGSARLNEAQVGLYAEDAFQATPRLLLTAGIRTDHFSFNREWTWSPRLSMQLETSDRLTLAGAVGLYHQAPTYRELRGSPPPDTPVLAALNRNLRSQRSLQIVMGGELFLPVRRLYIRAEGYWKSLANVISYSLENVRIDYSGLNDARGHAYGLDLQARGEFVPGLESWVNYGLLVARERFLPTHTTPSRTGWNPRPTDQRHTVALYVQDYIPTDPSWKLHMRALFGSGLPYTPPIPGERVGSVVTQIPGDRLSARYPAFRRMDFGATKDIELPFAQLAITAEILNIFDMTNTVSYAWVPDATGIWQRIPTRLTPRTVNVRLRTTL